MAGWQIALGCCWRGQPVQRDNLAPRQPVGEASAHVRFRDLKSDCWVLPNNRKSNYSNYKSDSRLAKVIIHCRNGGPDLGDWGRR